MQRIQTIYAHDKFTENAHHWSSDSEDYAAASHLIGAVRAGWLLAMPRVRARHIWNSGSRARTLYEFTLVRDSQLMIMPVLANPFVERYLIQNDIRVIYGAAAESVRAPG